MNYYLVLGLAPSASREDIRQAYKTLSRANHPDVSKKDTTLIMQQLNDAKATLLDEDKREAYDRVLHRAARVGLGPGSGIKTPEVVLMYMVCPEYAYLKGYSAPLLCGTIFFSHVPFFVASYFFLEYLRWGRIPLAWASVAETVGVFAMRLIIFLSFVMWLCLFLLYGLELLVPCALVSLISIITGKYMRASIRKFFVTVTSKYLCVPKVLQIRNPNGRPAFLYVRESIAEKVVAHEREQEMRKQEREQRVKDKKIRSQIESERMNQGALEAATVADISYVPQREEPCLSTPLTDDDNTPLLAEPLTWADDDLQSLQRAIVKFPPGTVNRWAKMQQYIAKRGVTEKDIITKTRELESDWCAMKKASTGNTVDAAVTSIGTTLREWTPKQQKQLEEALKTLKDYKEKDKWDKIAEVVEGKTRSECVARYKYLCTVSKA